MMRYKTNHYSLEFFYRTIKKYREGHTGHDLEKLRILATKPYYNYKWIGKKRIVQRTFKKIWESKK